MIDTHRAPWYQYLVVRLSLQVRPWRVLAGPVVVAHLKKVQSCVHGIWISDKVLPSVENVVHFLRDKQKLRLIRKQPRWVTDCRCDYLHARSLGTERSLVSSKRKVRAASDRFGWSVSVRSGVRFGAFFGPRQSDVHPKNPNWFGLQGVENLVVR
jgi:hypothetical protein